MCTDDYGCELSTHNVSIYVGEVQVERNNDSVVSGRFFGYFPIFGAFQMDFGCSDYIMTKAFKPVRDAFRQNLVDQYLSQAV